ncbi:MAG: hypothetical protein NTV02_03320 [Candidatus Zambryskibacteria bacterium]|nr:hypothetical protein [Candidatus Zambryskibacteria bacterium]
MKKISQSTSGFATLEILIALFILTTALSASTLVAFGNQTLLVDSKSNREALELAETLLETAQVKALTDWRGVVSFATSSARFESALEVTSIDYVTKQVKAKVNWKNSYNINQHVTLSSLITDFQNTAEGDTCDPTLSGDWTKPETKNTVTAFKNLVSDPAGNYIITNLDVYHDRLFVTANNSSQNKETFFVFDVEDSTNPTLISKLDNDLTLNTGLNAVTIASTTDGVFAYVASATSFTKGQLQIINVSVNPPVVIKTFKIPLNIVSGSSTQGTGVRIAYKNGYVYLGLSKTVSGPEFNIIDVRNPNNPVWVGGFTVGSSINDIVIHGEYAYLATPHSQELMIVDISDPSNPALVGGYDAPSSNTTGSGKSIYLANNRVYLGRTITSSNPEFYIIDANQPRTYTPQVLGFKEVNTSINQLLVRESLAYFLTTAGTLQFWDIATTSDITSYTTGLVLPQNSKGVALDCEKNVLFVGSVPTTGAFIDQGFLSLISTE